MILDDLRFQIDSQLVPWIKSQGLDALPSYTLEEPPAGIEADVACNIALLLAKPLKKSPRALAEDLRKTVEGSLVMVDAVSIAGAGFLNFRLNDARWQKEVATVGEEKTAYGRLAHEET